MRAVSHRDLAWLGSVPTAVPAADEGRYLRPAIPVLNRVEQFRHSWQASADDDTSGFDNGEYNRDTLVICAIGALVSRGSQNATSINKGMDGSWMGVTDRSYPLNFEICAQRPSAQLPR